MNKEKEIEGMANELHSATNESYVNCRKIARILVDRRGYGNVKQAVKEFAENAVKPIIDELVELLFNDNEPDCKVDCKKGSGIPCGSSICIDENKQYWKRKVDKLIKEVYGDEEDKN